MLCCVYILALLSLLVRTIASHDCKIGIVELAKDPYDFGLAKCVAEQRRVLASVHDLNW